MSSRKRSYIAIDLKSFYASAECMKRGRNPLTTNLVVADESRTERTICLAVSPSLKEYGIPGRARLFEVIRKIKEVNARKLVNAPGHRFAGKSDDAEVLKSCPGYAVDFITAPPRMAEYIRISAEIYRVYLKYISREDIHVYSVDEVFMDVTDYLETYQMTERELAMTMIRDVLRTTGITATAGIGTNLYLCKIAMDIVAKHMEPDENGVRIAQLDEMSYRRLLWDHRPLTDFWRVGKGYAGKLERAGLYTMGDIARCSLGGPQDFYNEDLLYKMFGINAELLIDHAWGWEPCRICDIKAYQPENSSLGAGQVLKCPYSCRKARIVVGEMADSLSLDLIEKRLVTDQVVLTVGYDIENLTDEDRKSRYKGSVVKDHYGRNIPKHAHGTENLDGPTSSGILLTEAVMRLYDRIVDPDLLIRRITLSANHIAHEQAVSSKTQYEQMDLFTDYDALEIRKKKKETELKKERHMQQAVLDIRKKFGKNAVLKGLSFQEGATARERNGQIGGHKA